MIWTRQEVKAIVAEAFEILIECEDEWAEHTDMPGEELREMIRARMKEWKEREL